MRELATVLGGIGLLIFAYLAFTNAPGVTKIADSIAKDSGIVINTLQGRSATIV